MLRSRTFAVSSFAIVSVLAGLSGCSGGGSSQQPGFALPGEAEGGADSKQLLSGKADHAQSAAPVVGGTLLVTQDGQTIVVSDPERDSVFLVSSATRTVTPVPLQAGDEPGRIAEGPNGSVFVALRRAGALVAIDRQSGSIVQRVPVCASPRGIAYDAKSASVHVACRSGRLQTLAAADLSLKHSLQLDTDLRDVIVRDHDLVLTRFLSAEVLVVSEDGVSKRATPAPQPGCAEATVAFRAFVAPSGQIAVAHQVSSNDVVQESAGGYGFSCGGALVSRFLSMVDVDTPSPQATVLSPDNGQSVTRPASAMTFHSVQLPATGPLDVAIDAQGQRMAAIALNESLANRGAGGGGVIPKSLEANPLDANLWIQPWDGVSQPNFGDSAQGKVITINGQPVAVAFDAAGKYIVQSREPATLEFEDGQSLTLSKESHADTGHTLFHMDSGIGISCSSCHPEGGEDGHVWRFPEGLRRTLPLEGGVMERAPFHWDGTLGDMQALAGEVMVQRMAILTPPSEAQIKVLGSFLEQLPVLPAAEGLDSAAVTRGEALFKRADVQCATCHGGPQYTDNRLQDVGTGGSFVTPSLLGVGLRTSLFHDGCASTVEQRFGACGGTAHGKPELLSDTEKADLIAFLRSL
jgi:cytochrome c553